MEVTQVQIDTQDFDEQAQIDTYQDQDAQNEDTFCDEVDKESQDLSLIHI